MVFPAILAKLGLGATTGLAQGGGFGLGYGFMVRAGYDLYGQMRDSVLKTLMGQRYNPLPAPSMAATGGLMGLQRTQSNTSPAGLPASLGGYKNSGMTQQQYDAKAKFIGGAHKMDAYLAGKSKQNTPPNSSKLPIDRRTGQPMSQWYYDKVYLPKKKSRQSYYNKRTSNYLNNFHNIRR